MHDEDAAADYLESLLTNNTQQDAKQVFRDNKTDFDELFGDPSLGTQSVPSFDGIIVSKPKL